jgi:glycolate oxidase FAD binding subunit
MRDLIIGIHFIRADGVAARGGGKVVKNVAGFDLPKLLVGSLGTLGLITTVTCRLHPLPETQETLLMPNRSAADVRALAAQIRAAQLEPAAVVALREGADFAVFLRFEGFRAGTLDQKERLISLISPQGQCLALDEAGARYWAARHDRLRVEGTLRAKIVALPGSLETVLPECVAPLSESLEHGGFVSYPTLGVGFVSGHVSAVGPVAQAIEKARQALDRMGGSLVVEEAPAEVRARCDVWGQTTKALSLMRSVKARLDPEHRMAPGRFVGGI